MRIKVKYPCQNCVYFKACGDYMRTKPCKGRMTEAQRRKAKKEKRG